MKDQMKNHVEPEETFSDALKSVVQKIEVNASFKAELGKQLAEAHQPARLGFGQSAFNRAIPAFGWVFALALMALVLNWMFRSIAPPPIPAAQETPSQATQDIPSPAPTEFTTPSPDGESYDWRGAKLYLAQPLPESPADAHVYLLKDDQRATLEEARALADQFGIEGEIYRAPDQLAGTSQYLITDGKRSLSVSSKNHFLYSADIAKSKQNASGHANANAEAIINEFLQLHSFDQPFKISNAESGGGYILQQLAPDGIPMQFDLYSAPVVYITLDENGEVLSMEASLMEYDQSPIGSYGIITAEEAFQKLFDETGAGQIESIQSMAHELPQEWYRRYPDNQTVTIYGFTESDPSVDPTKPPLILIDKVQALGNIGGMEALEYSSFIEATGQYVIENGIRKFDVETWNANITQSYMAGTLHRIGGQIILTADDGNGTQYPLIDAPADLPLDTKTPPSLLSVSGVIVDGNLFWTYIQYFEDMNRADGGGGGGGIGFNKPNLSGTPLPFPTPTSQSQTFQGTFEYIVQQGDTIPAIAQSYGINPERIVQANSWLDAGALIPGKTLVIPGGYPEQHAIGERVEGLRGTVIVNIYRHPDGSQRVEYWFLDLKNINGEGTTPNYLLSEGTDLQDLQGYHHRPIDIWGTIDRLNRYGEPVIKVDRFEVPYPDLQIQILEGTQKMTEIQGASFVTLTTQDGTTYVQLGPAGEALTQGSLVAKAGEKLLVQGLVIPSETFGGYPALRTFDFNFVIDSTSGLANEISATADQPFVMQEEFSPDDTIPSYTIEKAELVYFISDPRFTAPDPNAGPQYIQPVWRFYGYYGPGDEFEILVQALKQEFLLPELMPHSPPG